MTLTFTLILGLIELSQYFNVCSVKMYRDQLNGIGLKNNSIILYLIINLKKDFDYTQVVYDAFI